MTATLTELCGYLGFGLDVIATWLFTQKHVWAWPCSLVSLVFWFIYGWRLGERPLLVHTSVFFVICAYGWWCWWTDEQPPVPD